MGILTKWTGSRMIPDGVRLLLARAQTVGVLDTFGDPKSPWSLVRLGLDESDYLTLCEWYRALEPNHVRAFLGKTQAREYELPNTKKLSVENEASFGLLFLALSAETARRRCDSFGDLWQFVAAQECDLSVSNLLFTAGGQPTSQVKDALRAAYRKFGIRNADDRDVGVQRYYQTVLLQVGIPEGALSSLLGFLGGATQPDAIRSLLSPGPGGDPSFQELWGMMQRSRGHLTEKGQQTISDSPWLRPEAAQRVIELLRRAPIPDTSATTDTAAADLFAEPIGAPHFAAVELQLRATPKSFAPTFERRGQTVVDLFIQGKRRCRYTLEEGLFCPNDTSPIDLLAISDVTLELRFLDGTPAGEPRSLELWDDDAQVACVETEERGTVVLLVDSTDQPTVTPVADSITRLGDRWAIRVSRECTVLVDGATVWHGGRAPAEEIDVRSWLHTAFEAGTRGSIAVTTAAPWRVTSVNIAGVNLELRAAEPETNTWFAEGILDQIPEGPTAVARIALAGPRGTRVLHRRVPLAAGAWVRGGSTWQRIDPREELDLRLIPAGSSFRFGLPGLGESGNALLAGDWTLGAISASKVPLPGRPLAYGEPLLACNGLHGWAPTSEATVSVSSAVVRRGIGASLERRDGSSSLVLSEPVAIGPSHRMITWFTDGTVATTIPSTTETPSTHVSVPGSARAAALVVEAAAQRPVVQAVAWTSDWSEEFPTDVTLVHIALLVTRAFGLPFLMEPHRERVRQLTWTHPAMTGRAWLARDPQHGAACSDLNGLLAELDDGSGDIWHRAIRQLLEPGWRESFAEKTTANRLFDELRRDQTEEPSSDYRRATHRLLAVGPQAAACLIENVSQSDDGLRERLRAMIVKTVCNDPPRRGRAPAVDPLVAKVECELGLASDRVGTLLQLDADRPAHRAAIHMPHFRRLTLRNLLCSTTSPETK